LLAQRPHATATQQQESQETIDALQNRDIADLKQAVQQHSDALIQLQADRNWLLGGVSVIGGALVLVQLISLVQLRKKGG
jgi:hypothetical protein